MKTLVNTNLTIGMSRIEKFGKHKLEMHHNPNFSRPYNEVEAFIKDFYPTKPSKNLLNRIQEEFENGGKITYKPEGYKANQTFYFTHEN